MVSAVCEADGGLGDCSGCRVSLTFYLLHDRWTALLSAPISVLWKDTQCTLAKKAFYSTRSWRSKSKVTFYTSLTGWGLPYPLSRFHSIKVKFASRKNWDQAFLASHILITSIMFTWSLLHLVLFSDFLFLRGTVGWNAEFQVSSSKELPFSFGKYASQTKPNMIKKKTNQHRSDYGSHPRVQLGTLNVALRVTIAVCVLCILGDALSRSDY